MNSKSDLTIIRKPTTNFQKPHPILNNLIEVKFTNQHGYRLVKETLKRIGLLKPNNSFEQICYLFFKMNKYYIAHYKELEILYTNDCDDIELNDLVLRNKIANELVKYDLIKIINNDIKLWEYGNMSFVIDNRFVKFTVLSFNDAKEKTLIQHFVDGVRHE